MIPKRPAYFAFLLALIPFFAAACGRPSDEDIILGLLSDAARFAEKGDATRIIARLDATYADFEGRDRAATGAMLEEYFARYRGIAANILRSEVEDLSAREAVVRTDVALSWGALQAVRKLARVSLDNYRLRFRLRKSGGEWRFVFAEWRALDVAEVLSESGH
mgnify:CR=1 FL=1|jgi:hypothetical protein